MHSIQFEFFSLWEWKWMNIQIKMCGMVPLPVTETQTNTTLRAYSELISSIRVADGSIKQPQQGDNRDFISRLRGNLSHVKSLNRQGVWKVQNRITHIIQDKTDVDTIVTFPQVYLNAPVSFYIGVDRGNNPVQKKSPCLNTSFCFPEILPRTNLSI